MIREFIARLRKRAQEIAEAFVTRCGSALKRVMLPLAAGAGIFWSIVPAVTRDAPDAGEQSRLTGSHAPVFSLFTFFGIR